MNERNAEQSPETESQASTAAASGDAEAPVPAVASSEGSPAVSTRDTVLPRYLAAFLDNVIAMILCIVAAKSVADDLPVAQSVALVGVYYGYYWFFEGFVSRTPGKFLTGLVVIQFNGARCTWRQSFIRTCFRVLEVNPVLLGAIPAALCIVRSRHHQRFGDMAAGTIVVKASEVRKRRELGNRPR